MSANQKGNWCVCYRKLGVTPYTWSIMKLQRSDGVLVSAKTYTEASKFNRYKEAWDIAKELITQNPPKYDAQVKRICKAKGDAFYLSGS